MLQYTDKTKNLIYQTNKDDIEKLSNLLYNTLSDYQLKYDFKLLSPVPDTYIACAVEEFKGSEIKVIYMSNHSYILDGEFLQVQVIIDNKKYCYEEHKLFHTLEPIFSKISIMISLTHIFNKIKGDLQ